MHIHAAKLLAHRRPVIAKIDTNTLMKVTLPHVALGYAGLVLDMMTAKHNVSHTQYTTVHVTCTHLPLCT